MTEDSASEKYLGDWIHQDGTTMSVSETIRKRIHKANETSKDILTICSDPRLIGFPTAWGAVSEYNTKVLPQLLNNCESWLGISDSDIKILQDFQDNYILSWKSCSIFMSLSDIPSHDSQCVSYTHLTLPTILRV